MQDRESHIVTIDAARGAFAFGVMMYHLLYFNEIVQLEQIAYYAVYGFFVISGFALFVAYRDRLTDFIDIRSYFLKRFFRIAPLFFAVLALRLYLSPWPSDMAYRLLLNLTLSFGIANPGSTSLVGGGWSIGIEMVFYLIFPIIMILSKQSVVRLGALALFAIIVMMLFVNVTLRGHASMLEGDIWERYTQPVAFFGYFAVGILLGALYFKYPRKGQAISYGLIVVGLLPFFLIKTDTTLALLTRWTGVVLMASTLLIVTGFTLLPEPTGKLRAFATWLGALSYPVYLLHPLAYLMVTPWLSKGWGNMIAVVVVTILLSMVIGRFIERPLRGWGRRLATVHSREAARSM